MTISRRTFSKLILAAFGAGALGSTAGASNLPAPFDKPGSVRMALVRYLSTGDFFESYLAVSVPLHRRIPIAIRDPERRLETRLTSTGAA